VERVCFLARVRPDRLDEYRARHESVWPEMRAALDAMAATEVNKRWQAEMSEFFVADGPPDQSNAGSQRSFTWIREMTPNA
jgi:L-rhamnose mutarotase